MGKGGPLGRPRFRNGGRPTGYRCGVSPRGGRPKRALREPAGARCRRMAQPARAPAHPAPRRAPIEPGTDERMRILLFSSYGMLAFLASKRLLLSGELLFGVSHHGLLRALHFTAATFGAVLGGPRTESGSSLPFPVWARSGVRLRSVSDRGVSVCSKRFACARQIFLVFRRRFSVFHNRF